MRFFGIGFNEMIYYFHYKRRSVMPLLLWISIAVFLLGWSIGYSGVASIFGVSTANGIIRYRTSAILSAVFVFIGAYFGGHRGLENVSSMIFIEDPRLEIIIAISAALTGIILAQFGISVSITQGIIGAITAAGLMAGNVNWTILYQIILGWILTPISGIILGLLFYKLFKPFFNKIKSLFIQQTTIKILSIIVGVYGSYALGANNFAVVVGPFFSHQSDSILIIIGALSFSFGAIIYSRRITNTVGRKITVLDPLGVIIAMFAQSTTVWIYSLLGIPVSVSQAIVGGVIGVGLAGSSRLVSWGTMLKMIIGWLFTPIMSGVMVAFIYLLLTKI